MKRIDNDFREYNIDNNLLVFRSEGVKELFGDLKFFVFGELFLVLII